LHGRIEDGALVSDELPPLRLRPAPGFEYRGSCELEIAEIALAARHHFLDVASSRLLIVQLEHYTAPDRTYSFELQDPIVLSAHLRYLWISITLVCVTCSCTSVPLDVGGVGFIRARISEARIGAVGGSLLSRLTFFCMPPGRFLWAQIL